MYNQPIFLPVMDRQINITIPETTMQLIDRTMPQENLNQLIDKALNFYINQNVSENLKEELRTGAIERAERDLKLPEEFSFPVNKTLHITPASKGSRHQETSINHDSVIADITNQE
ncbi:MAG: hypothetical protein SWX82_27245 [Cyanobacteriota bacterium]|nr:hypothetical protein [Cyanobacteriota bacterium]